MAHQHHHEHGSDRGHTAVQPGGYLHDGHSHSGHFNDQTLDASAANPDDCTPRHDCDDHAEAHVHGVDCGHDQVPDGDHMGYLVGGYLYQAHGDHRDEHSTV